MSSCLAIAFATGCLKETDVHPDRLPTGQWGGTDISFVATATGATMQFSCGVGTVKTPLTLDGEGNFTWTGTTQRVGGAVNPNGPEPEVATTFSGVASISRLVLNVIPVNQPSSQRSFELIRGDPGVVYLCP